VAAWLKAKICIATTAIIGYNNLVIDFEEAAFPAVLIFVLPVKLEPLAILAGVKQDLFDLVIFVVVIIIVVFVVAVGHVIFVIVKVGRLGVLLILSITIFDANFAFEADFSVC